MVADIRDNGVQKEIVVFEIVLDEIADSGEYKRQLFIINGARRFNHAVEAEKLNRAAGILADDECMRLKFKLFEGTMVEALMEQLRDNADPLKVADSVAVLAVMINKLLRLGIAKEKIVAKCPKGIGAVEVEALTQWAKLTLEVATRFESGEAPIGLLAAVVACPETKQMEMLDKLLSAGAKTSKGATRALRKDSARNSGRDGRAAPPEADRQGHRGHGEARRGQLRGRLPEGYPLRRGQAGSRGSPRRCADPGDGLPPDDGHRHREVTKGRGPVDQPAPLFVSGTKQDNETARRKRTLGL
jgi:hypothetical protein